MGKASLLLDAFMKMKNKWQTQNVWNIKNKSHIYLNKNIHTVYNGYGLHTAKQNDNSWSTKIGAEAI